MELEEKYIAPGVALLDEIWERRTFGDWNVTNTETVDVVDHYYDFREEDGVGRLAAAGALFRLRLKQGRVIAALKLKTTDERVRHEHEVEPDPALWPDLFVTGDGWNTAVISPSRPPCPTLGSEVVAALARALDPDRPGVSLLESADELAHALTVVNRRRVLAVVRGKAGADISLLPGAVAGGAGAAGMAGGGGGHRWRPGRPHRAVFPAGAGLDGPAAL